MMDWLLIAFWSLIGIGAAAALTLLVGMFK